MPAKTWTLYLTILLMCCVRVACAEMPDDESDISGTIRLDDFVYVEEEEPAPYLKLVTKTEDVAAFKFIEIRSTIDSKYNVGVIVDKRLKDYAIVEITGPAGSEGNYYAAVEGETLVLESCNPFQYTIAFKITVGEFHGVKLSGDNTMTIENLYSETLNVSMDQQSHLFLNGSVNKCSFDISGDSILDSRELQCGSIEISCKSSSIATVNPFDTLKAVSYGTCEIYYVNQPKIIKKEIKSFGFISYR
ncbi:hypothetical protein DSCO28_73390 (plasmid) [Desulfosarcina ovata subsp. sediminis]|uniref:Putative auto-transporter adhesin head GIN domain-containing protein n=1 Tax=Desulfosarcina ovata subsp. sediminis TaxID=885957 RepID=A0A5K8A2J9_9BACT|nr:DUF2807 domain-containing protein [Desulfosarcina ovata]BBO86773.1 hypothetical protein DSCO28_73390 [Desulfosarcina ovata subsp. sediminis]